MATLRKTLCIAIGHFVGLALLILNLASGEGSRSKNHLTNFAARFGLYLVRFQKYLAFPMKLPTPFRLIVTIAIGGLLTVYSSYFFFRYAAYSLLIDQESIAIEELVRARMMIATARTLERSIVGPNRTMGCSFLLLEEIWRDCKSIRAPNTGRQINRLELSLILETVAAPCRWAMTLPYAERTSILESLRCESKSRIFYATVFALQGDDRVILGKTRGEFVKWP